MNINDIRYSSIEQVTGQYLNQNTKKPSNNTTDISFDEVLRQSFGIKFSKHAAQRLSDRNIALSDDQLDRLQRGAKLSSDKGIKESLVLMDEYAFIVNTENNTVITAMEHGREGENIYTNIDGAVLV